MAPPVIKLNNGLEIPQVGFGLWKVGKDVCEDVVYGAIEQGVRLLGESRADSTSTPRSLTRTSDGACDYGNEVECGRGVGRAIRDGLVKREDLWITSKLWNTFHRPGHARTVVKRQLKDWGIDYFDVGMRWTGKIWLT